MPVQQLPGAIADVSQSLVNQLDVHSQGTALTLTHLIAHPGENPELTGPFLSISLTATPGLEQAGAAHTIPEEVAADVDMQDAGTGAGPSPAASTDVVAAATGAAIDTTAAPQPSSALQQLPATEAAAEGSLLTLVDAVLEQTADQPTTNDPDAASITATTASASAPVVAVGVVAELGIGSEPTPAWQCR